MKKFILLFQCLDQKGIVARISDFIFRHGGNIVTADQYSTDPEGGYFFMRVEFILAAGSVEADYLSGKFAPVAEEFSAQWKIVDKSRRLRMGIFVSEEDHCLLDLFYLYMSGELDVHIPFVLSNSEKHRRLLSQHNIPFHYVPAEKENRREQELLSYAMDTTDFLVLARYMLVLSPEFLLKYNRDIINIHHGFLPAFKGADPYGKALKQGVKVIGATAHFVSEKLDEGPIIAQEVEHVSHKDSRQELIRKGRNLENKALANAVLSYIDYRIIRHENRTIVF